MTDEKTGAPAPKHTPGPWLIDMAETTSRWPVIYVPDASWDAGKREIAEISDIVAFNVSHSGKERWKTADTADMAMANARLIAAAPEMLAALKASVRGCGLCAGRGSYLTPCSMCGDSTYDHACDDERVDCARCKAAVDLIAKIDGLAEPTR